MAFISFEADLRQLNSLQSWVRKFDTVVDSPETMSPGIKIIGKHMLTNFKGEGSSGRKWQNLTAYTNRVRAERGYPEAHPILKQSGELENATAGTLASWRSGQTGAQSSGTGINMAASVGIRSFQATATGAKVQNHYGGKLPPLERGGPSTYLPARPFFYIIPDIIPEVAAATVTRIMVDWNRRRRG